MKKLVPGIIALMMCFGGLTACDAISNLIPGLGNSSESSSTVDSSSTAQEHEAELLNVRPLVFAEMLEASPVSNKSYTVMNSCTVEGVTYDVSWTVTDANGNAVAGVSISEGEANDTVVIDVENDVAYVLTGTITCPDGCCSISHKFNRTAAAAPVPVAIDKAPVEGVAYKFYVFQAAKNGGTDCYLTGEIVNKYYMGSTPDYSTSIDLYVKNVTGGFNLYHVKDGENVYINVVKSGTHTNAKYQTLSENATPTVWTFDDTEWKTIVTTLSNEPDSKYYLGCDGTFDTVEPQYKTGDGYFTGYLCEMKNKSEVVITDAKKVATTLESLSFAEKYTLDKENIILATAGSKYAEVAITWAAEGTGAVLEGNFISFIIPEEATTVTVTATATCGEVSESKTFSIVLGPKSVEVTDKTNVAAILAAANNLAVGETLPGFYTFTGTITSIDTAWDSNYGNITVSFKVNDDTTMKCYRLKNAEGVDAASALKVGDVITVYGQLMNHNGKVQFGQGCTLQAVEAGESGGNTPDTPTYSTPEEIVAAAWALAPGATLGQYTLTGVVASIDEAYSTQFKNVTLTIIVAGMDNYPIICYRMKGTDAENVKAGDTITVSGTLMNYLSSSAEAGDPGKVEFSPCTLDAIVSEGGNTPVEPEQPDEPSGGETTMTQEDIVNAAYALEKDTALEGTYTLTGVITLIDTAYNSQFSNVSVVIVVEGMTDKPILCYRMKGTGADTIGKADVITVTGTIKNYGGKVEFDAGCTFVLVSAHECSEYGEATCEHAALCVACDEAQPGSAPVDHVYVDGACKWCSAPEGVSTISASKTMTELIASEGWTNATTKQEFSLDDVVTVKVNGGNNSGKAYDGNHIRIYATDTPAGTLTITLAEGYELVSVKVSAQEGTYAFLCVDGTTTDICNQTVAVSGSSVLLNSVKNGSNGKQVRVTAIEVVYKAV